MGEQDHHCAGFRVLAGILRSNDIDLIDALGICISPDDGTCLTFLTSGKS